jgi:hypothetical protein
LVLALATFVVLVIAELAVEMEIDGMGVSDVVALMIDFGVNVWDEGVVTQFDAAASEGEADFVESAVEADGTVLAHGAFDTCLEESFEGIRADVELSEVFGAFLEACLRTGAGAAVGACVIVCLDPAGELGVEGF